MARVELLSNTTAIPSRKVLIKALTLAAATQSSICIFAKDYQRSEDHTFLDLLLSEDRRRKSLSDSYLRWSAQVLEKVDLISKEEGVDCKLDLIRLEGRHWAKQMLTAQLSSEKLPILIDRASIRVTSDLLSVLAKANRNVLLLTDKMWVQNSTALAAIDPLHREDKDAKVDETVVETGRSVAKLLNMNIELAYCRFVAGYLNEYKSEILESQKRGVVDFVSDKGFHQIPIVFGRGNPEFALPEIVKVHKASLLVMGACRRGSVSRFLTGSTVDVMLKNPPCDLLLVTHF
ncbi:universal stress protein [Vibrio maritimus]|uniref:universal stress protein n=1 Tax=Vibrio maritimus TaxID=990268 RepID=UPI00373589C8